MSMVQSLDNTVASHPEVRYVAGFAHGTQPKQFAFARQRIRRPVGKEYLITMVVCGRLLQEVVVAAINGVTAILIGWPFY